MSDLYTIVADYQGGTYVAQVVARDVAGAVRSWGVRELATVLGRRRLSAALQACVEELGERRADLEPSPLDGLENAWCLGFLVPRGGMVLLNVVLTRKAPSRPGATRARRDRGGRPR